MNIIGPAVGVSATPELDGYHVTLDGFPYHIHPSATPAEWEVLSAEIAAGEIEVQPYSSPVEDVGMLWKARQEQAKIALDRSDMVAIRCFKAAVAYPENWKTYVVALRAIVSATTGDVAQAFPVQPAYPEGT